MVEKTALNFARQERGGVKGRGDRRGKEGRDLEQSAAFKAPTPPHGARRPLTGTGTKGTGRARLSSGMNPETGATVYSHNI
ncbi:hypothetical protein GN956_G21958 [Arapaima gigas]